MVFLSELLEAGAEKNSNMPMFSGFFFCKTCDCYKYHTMYSMRDDWRSRHFEVCDTCKTYHGIHEDWFHKYQNEVVKIQERP